MKFDRVSSARGLAGLAVAAVAFGVICAPSARTQKSAVAAAPDVEPTRLPANRPDRLADLKSILNQGKAPAHMKSYVLGDGGVSPQGEPPHIPVGTSCAIDNATPNRCQLPNQSGNGPDGITAATSDDAAGFEVSDNFTFAANGNITQVCWWGTFTDFTIPCPGPDSPTSFTITYFTNNPSCPSGVPSATIKAGPFLVAPVSSATGLVIPSGIGDLVEWSFSAAHAPVAVTAGECVWIEIKNNAGAGTCLWLWETAPPGDSLSFQAGGGGSSNYDLAFCTNGGALAVPDCSLDPISQCLAAIGDCGEAHATPGCDDPCCCSLVCADDTFCCDEEWDETCALTALQLGCATFPLCASCDQGGQTPSTENAFNSTRDSSGIDIFRAAEDFTPVNSGNVNSVCWQGVYLPGNVPDVFRIRYMRDTDGDHYPETVMATFTQPGSLNVAAKNDTGTVVDGTTAAIFQYEATHANVAVTAGECYWLEITNDVGSGGTSWFWEMTQRGPVQANDAAPPKQGNGLFLVDASQDTNADGIPDVAPDGYNFGDEVTDLDLTFCLGIPLTTPACKFTTLHDTGQHQTVLFNAAASHLGWSSGNLGPGQPPQRRSAQPFNVPVSPSGAWDIRHILYAGFDAVGAVNETENFEIHSRTSLEVPPTPGSLLETIQVGHGAFDATSERSGFISTDLIISPGTYWLAFWGDNDNVPFVVSNIAWFTNAHSGINAFCVAGSPPPPGAPDVGCQPTSPGGAPLGSPKMLRARTYPAPGYGAYTLPLATLDVDPVNDPTPDPNDKYNAEFVVRAYPAAAPCPWDCQVAPDGNVGINDLLDLLAQWNTNGACNFDGGLVGITDLLKLLANWGPC